MNQLTTYQPDQLMQLGQVIARSGMFSDTRDEAQAIVKVLAGAEMGFGPIASMTGIHVIKGKVIVGANLIAATIKRSGKYDYRVTFEEGKCSITFHQRSGDGWEQIGFSVFTLDDAKKAGLLGSANWSKYPRNMLFARAISNGARWYTPDVFGAPVYTPDEFGVMVDDDGDPVIEVEAPAPPAVTDSDRKAFHRAGRELYGKEWDAKRPELVRAITKGEHTSSTNLTQAQMEYLTNNMLNRIDQRTVREVESVGMDGMPLPEPAF